MGRLYLSLLQFGLLRPVDGCKHVGLQLCPRNEGSSKWLIIEACAAVEVQFEVPGPSMPIFQLLHVHHELELGVKHCPASAKSASG